MDPNQKVEQKQVPQPEQAKPAQQQGEVNKNPEPPISSGQEKKNLQQHMQMHQKQQNMIRQQIQAESPLIGELFPLGMLMDEFIQNQGFYIKIQELMNTYDKYRKTRRDGSCFYRALAYCIFYQIVRKSNNVIKDKITQKIKKCKQHLIKAHFEGIVFQDIQQFFLQKLGSKLPKNEQQLLQFFRDPEESNYIVLLLRFITSGQIRNNAMTYQIFMDDQMPAETFCQLQVQPIDKQADQIQIVALLNYLQMGIRIVYLDGSQNKQAYRVILPQSFKPEDIVGELLYRPGHYDILYR